jgi:ABC-2 type transport system ATP-binding protein
MTKPIISIKNMSKNYDSVNVINGLNWQVMPGEIVALLGKNGAGKSTLLECIMNILQFQSGELKLWGYSWDDLPQEKRVKIAYVSQEIQGFEWMRVKDFVDYLGGFFPLYDKKYANKLINDWGLIADKKIADLSKGQKQIVHVIQALSVKPELLILDEPVAHLDPSLRRKFIAELIGLTCEKKMTVLFSSHIISDVERIASQVSVLDNKKIKLQYDMEELKSSIAHIKIAADKPLEHSKCYKNLNHWQSYAQGVTAKIIKPLSGGIEEFIKDAPDEIEYTPMTLEDWYLEVSRGED